MDDCVLKGRSQSGPVKLPDVDIESIELLWAEGRISQRALSARFGVSQQQISKILRGESRNRGRGVVIQAPWQEAGWRSYNTVLTDEQVAEIRARYATGQVTQRQLSAEYGVCQPHISHLVRYLKRKAVS